ncbi:ABC transporter substrate-binding protein [Nocardia jejuensis]|uniref:ABC transporter substrate-binding protein n=1 Tax=Nocardia jejuensis TaxID=328049 RepID=UPI00083480A2|nr:NrtA/SsuA/CpmA family ABC transporter substrate-binding protein [Nocardia jejuensis]
MRNLKRLVPAVVAALALVLSGCGSGGDNSATRTEIKTLRIGTIGSGNVLTGTLGFAHQRGALLPALKPLGVDNIEVYSFPNGPDLNQALVGGRLDVAGYGDTPALVARGSGLKTRLLGIVSVNYNAGVVAKDPAVRTLKDLAGKKIGVQSGSYIDRYLQGALQAEGIKAELVHLLATDAEAPLNGGDVAAVALPDVNPSASLQAFLAKGFHLVDSVRYNHPAVAGTSAAVSSQDFLDTHKDFGPAWQTILIEANKYALQHWDEYVNYEVSQSKAPEAVVRATARPEYIAEDLFSAQGVGLLTGTKQFLVDQKKIREDFSLEDWFYRPGKPAQS